MISKSLDEKLTKLRADTHCGEFILADAKDADMAFGVAAPGKSPEHHAHEGHFRTLEEYRECIRQVVRQGVVDIMLMSAHTNSILTIQEGIFEGSAVTPAARANDTTDIHVARGGTYITEPSRPFQSTTIDHIQCGLAECDAHERGVGANLGLYSVTFNNDVDLDHRSLEKYKAFRLEAEAKSFRHFLEVFAPNAPRNGLDSSQFGGFLNDMIARMLAGVPDSGRPVFLKMPYLGPQYTEELANYDPRLIIGVLGGSSGTTYDAFRLVHDAQKYGARAALFGRKINNAEHQLAFIELLRRIVDGAVSPEEAVHVYHGVLGELGIQAYRSLQDDLVLTDTAISYGGGTTVTVPGRGSQPKRAAQSRPSQPPRPRQRPLRATNSAAPSNGSTSSTGQADFAKMTSAERLAYHRRRLGVLGS